jgi:hypothetical protein
VSVILDKAQQEKDRQMKEWPRPSMVACSCGGTAHQAEKGSTRYVCDRCRTSITMWTGFDDPAWC